MNNKIKQWLEKLKGYTVKMNSQLMIWIEKEVNAISGDKIQSELLYLYSSQSFLNSIAFHTSNNGSVTRFENLVKDIEERCIDNDKFDWKIERKRNVFYIIYSYILSDNQDIEWVINFQENIIDNLRMNERELHDELLLDVVECFLGKLSQYEKTERLGVYETERMITLSEVLEVLEECSKKIGDSDIVTKIEMKEAIKLYKMYIHLMKVHALNVKSDIPDLVKVFPITLKQLVSHLKSSIIGCVATCKVDELEKLYLSKEE